MTPHSNSGFTLLEMLVVIVVMGLILALLTAYSPDGSHWLQTKAQAQSVAAAMDQARGQAIASGAPVALHLPAPPAWLTVTVTPPQIVFQPDGSATGGTVLLNDGGRQIAVSADWLTGRVHIDAPSAAAPGAAAPGAAAPSAAAPGAGAP